jgi:purine-binding chemotaxis protein CheW
MSEVPEWLLLFRTGSLRFGFDVDAVDRVIPALEVNPLPGAPASVRGVTVVSNEIVPVIDPTTPFKNGDGSPDDSMDSLDLTCRFVIVQTQKRILAVIAEEVDGVRDGAGLRLGAAGSLMERAPELMGVSVGGDGLIYVSNLERLISEADEIQLHAAMTGISHDRP